MDRPSRWNLVFQELRPPTAPAEQAGDADETFATAELAGLRAEVLRLVTWMLIAPAVVLFACLQYLPDPPEAVLWVSSLSLVAIFFITLSLLDHGSRLAGVFLVGSLSALSIGEAVLFRSPFPLFALPLISIVAGVTLGPVAAFASAVVAILASALEPIGGVTAYSLRDACGPAFFTLIAAALVWLGTRPLQITLAWSWNSYSRMLALTEDLRDQQTKLADTVRNLNTAYHSLERMNGELARAWAAADEARRLKVEFASHISHEFRTPLNLVIGFSGLLLASESRPGSDRLPTNCRPDVEAIHRNAQHLATLIDDVLELGEVEAGRLGLRKDWEHLGEVVDEAVDVVASLYAEKALAITRDVPADLPRLYVDRTRLRQVLINLLGNAVRFTTRGGVLIKASVQQSDVLVTMTDTGAGISPHDVEHAFEEFSQFQPADQRHARGSGLGLAICRRFIELHGGTIWVESTLGQGSSFHFTLPLATRLANMPTRSSSASDARSPTALSSNLVGDGRDARECDEPLVVLVSADPGPARLFQRHLGGYRVTAAADVGIAASVQSPNAIIRILGENDALDDALRDASKLGNQTPTLICRLPSERDLRDQLGVIDYIPKPFTSDRLLDALSRVPSPVRTVLVVDDSPEMVELIAQTLLASDRGYEVRRASGGAAALELLRNPTVQIDAVLLDLLMPAIDGLSVLETVRADAQLKSLPVIVISARGFIDHGVNSSVLAITRAERLTVRELMACADGVLKVLGASGTAAGPTERPGLR